MAKGISPEELEQILLQLSDGDEVMAIELARNRQIFTDCCTYNYTGIAEPPPDPPTPKPPK